MLYQLSHFRPFVPPPPLSLGCGAESQIRTGDTAIFSRVLYQLSYLGNDGIGTPAPERIARRRSGGLGQRRSALRARSRRPAPRPASVLLERGEGLEGPGVQRALP